MPRWLLGPSFGVKGAPGPQLVLRTPGTIIWCPGRPRVCLMESGPPGNQITGPRAQGTKLGVLGPKGIEATPFSNPLVATDYHLHLVPRGHRAPYLVPRAPRPPICCPGGLKAPNFGTMVPQATVFGSLGVQDFCFDAKGTCSSKIQEIPWVALGTK
jgi:hypothetical protein